MYTFDKPQPDAKALGEFNTKYVISPYELTDKNFSLKNKFSEYYVYQNEVYLPRAYFQDDNQRPGSEAKILSYKPNEISIDTSDHKSSSLILSEVWSPGWKAYLDGNQLVKVQETPNVLRLVDIRPDTKFVVFKYDPEIFKRGRLITVATLLFLFLYGVRKLNFFS